MSFIVNTAGDLARVATTGSYNDLSDTPQIVDTNNYLQVDSAYTLSKEETRYNGLWQESFSGILKKGGRYVFHLSGTCAFSFSGNYIKLVLTGIHSGVKRTVFSIAKDNGDSFAEQDVVVYPLEDSTLSIDSRYKQKLVLAGAGTYSSTINNVLPDRVSTIFGEGVSWPRHSSQTIRGSHDLSWHKGKLWSFDRHDFESSTIAKAYIYNEDNTSGVEKRLHMFETWKNNNENGLQFKSVDWHQGKNLLLVGNGQQVYSANDSYCYIFYEAESWEAMDTTSTPISFANCGDFAKIDFTSLGVKCYGYWGPDANADTMFVSLNLFQDIYLVQLGKGSNDLSQLANGGGVFATNSDPSKYNGSWVVINHWHQEEYEVLPDKTVRQSDHGGQYYGGNLYLGDNRTDMALVWKITLNDDGTMKWNRIRLRGRSAAGSESEGYVDGVCLKDGKMYANILGKGYTAIADIM